MAMTYASITGTLTRDGIGLRATIDAWPMTDKAMLTDAAEDWFHVGPVSATTDTAGVLTNPMQVPLNTDQGDIIWRFVITLLDKVPGLPKSWTLGHYEITASTNLANLVEVAVQAISPTLYESVEALVVEAETARDAALAAQAAAEAVGDTNEGIMSGVLGSGGAFDTELASVMAARVAAVESFVPRAAGVRYKPIFGVLRKVGGVWGLIDDATHTPTNIVSVSATANDVIIEYGFTGSKVATLVAVSDETWAAQGITWGTSVNRNNAVLRPFKRVDDIGAYVFYDATLGWQSSAPTGVFSSITMSSNTITLTHEAVRPSGTSMVSITGRNGVHYYSANSISQTQTTVQVWDLATGASVTTPNTNMKFYVHRPSNATLNVNPADLPEGNSNVWVVGWIEA
jgi:hypothetical protein